MIVTICRSATGLHRRLLDGSSRQLSMSSTTNQEDPQSIQQGQNMEKSDNTANKQSTTASSHLSSSMSSACNYSCSLQSSSTVGSTTTPLASTSPYPMNAPSSCLVLRRPSANMYSSFHFRFHFDCFNSIFALGSYYYFACP